MCVVVVTLTYSFSPIMFRIEEVRKGLLQFLTSVCAIVGGVFTVRWSQYHCCRDFYGADWDAFTQIMGVLDSVAFSVLNKSSRNLL